jgi:hypothetical protein
MYVITYTYLHDTEKTLPSSGGLIFEKNNFPLARPEGLAGTGS